MKNKNQKRIRNRAWAWIVTAGLTIGQPDRLWQPDGGADSAGRKDGRRGYESPSGHDKEDAVTQVLEEEFAQLEPQIHVVLEKKSDLTEALKMVGNDPKAAPDMYFFAHDKIGVYAEMGYSVAYHGYHSGRGTGCLYG